VLTHPHVSAQKEACSVLLRLADLDYLFCREGKLLLRDLALEASVVDKFRSHIGCTDSAEPALNIVLAAVEKLGRPPGLDDLLAALRILRVFVLSAGAPEHYFKHRRGVKAAWIDIETESDLVDAQYLKDLVTDVYRPI
jgi:hypothetical protein